jgi:hypothetical protein
VSNKICWKLKKTNLKTFETYLLRLTENGNASSVSCATVNTTATITNTTQMNQSTLLNNTTATTVASTSTALHANNTMPATCSSKGGVEPIISMPAVATGMPTGKPPIATPQAQKLTATSHTPATLTATNAGNSTLPVNPSLALHKQLKYDESPSMANQTCSDLASFKYRYFYIFNFLKIKKKKVTSYCIV